MSTGYTLRAAVAVVSWSFHDVTHDTSYFDYPSVFYYSRHLGVSSMDDGRYLPYARRHVELFINTKVIKDFYYI